MSRCAVCNLPLSRDAGICPHHQDGVYEHDWAATNRVMCDFFHRRIVPRRLDVAERDDDLLGQTTVVA